MKFKQLLKYFLFWQITIVVIFALSGFLLPLKKSDTYLGGGITKYLKNPLLNFRSNYDGVHYVLIATHGYNYGQQAFFPFYPSLIKRLQPTIKDPILAGTLISSVSFLIAMYFLSRLIRLDASPAVAKWTIISLLVFPTSFFFTSVYTEGLFFLLVILTFYSARKNRWLLAAIFGALASYTRLIGIFLLPALLVELWWQQNQNLIKPRQFAYKSLLLLIIPLGLLSYMWYLHRTTGDFLAFYNVQPLFLQARSLHITLPYQVMWRYIKMVLTVSRNDFIYLTIWLEFVTAIGFLVLSAISLFKQRPSYAVFSFLAFIVPTFTGNFVSLPRYVLVCFPAFILIGTLLAKNRKFRYLYLGLSVFLLVIFLSLFIRGYWVA